MGLSDIPSGGVSGQPLAPPDLCLACRGLFCQGDWLQPIAGLRVLERLSELTRVFPCPLTKAIPGRLCPSCSSYKPTGVGCHRVILLISHRRACLPSSPLPLFQGVAVPPHAYCLLSRRSNLGRAGADLEGAGSLTTGSENTSQASSEGPEIPQFSSAFQLENFHFQTPERQKIILPSQSIAYWLRLSVISTRFQLF